MILRTTTTSPYGRKARMAMQIHDLSDRIDLVPANSLDESDNLREQNPLGKMPCLVLPDGTAVFDSRVIVEYFDSLSDREPLVPRAGRARFDVMTRAVLCDGITDALPPPRHTDLASMALACALGYLDWRKPIAWREDHPALVDWLARFGEHEPSFRKTAAD